MIILEASRTNVGIFDKNMTQYRIIFVNILNRLFSQLNWVSREQHEKRTKYKFKM